MKKYRYPAEKFAAAQRALMLPHPRGIAHAITSCFNECMFGLGHVNRDDLPEDAKEWVARLDELMATDGLNDPGGVGLHYIKAQQLTQDEQYDLTRVVNDLEFWFNNH